MLFGVSAIVFWLWNCILPEVIGVQTITYWQAMGILVLSKILFGGFNGCKGRGGSQFRKRRLMHKMKQMNPEQREQFKAQWKARFQCKD